MLSCKIPTSKWPAVWLAVFVSLSVAAQDTTLSTPASASPTKKVDTFEFSTGGGARIKKISLEEYFRIEKKQQAKERQRLWLVAGTHVALWGGSYIALNKAWYADYPKESFHFFNDNGEWLQMDKAGHVWTAYQMSRLSGALWKWAGLNPAKSAWLGGISGVAYQSIIEIQDGFSSEWGFSWGDMAANVTGSALYVAQELLWKEQRLQVKLSYWPYDYTSPELKARRDQLFGKSIQERMLKDYNSQTYWLSANIRSFLPDCRLPKWLNIAAGYSAEGMYGGMENKWTDKAGTVYNRWDIARTRHFYLSADIDLTKIKTKSKFLRSAFFVLNMIKIPAPTLELSSKGKLRGHLLYF